MSRQKVETMSGCSRQIELVAQGVQRVHRTPEMGGHNLGLFVAPY